MSKRRVVITGLGIVSPVGNDVATAWATILAGPQRHRSRYSDSIPPTFQRTSAARSGIWIWRPYMTPKDARRMDAFMQYGVVAGMQAMRDSGLAGHRGEFRSHRHHDGFRHGRPRVDRGNLRQVSGNAFAEEGVAVLHTRPASSIWSADICRSFSRSPVPISPSPPPARPRRTRWAWRCA